MNTAAKLEEAPTPDGRVTTEGAAAYTGIAAKTFENWRSDGKGPVFIRIAGRVTYRIRDLDAFIDAHAIDPATDEGRERARVRPRPQSHGDD